MHPKLRKVLYAVTFEGLGILLCATVLHLLSQAPVDRSLVLSAANAVVALIWSLIFNTGFEAWEARLTTKGRSLLRRAGHAILFEGGLTVILVPATAWWLNVGWLAALAYESSLIAFFLLYAAAFTWAFDKIFGLPDSAR